MADPLTLAIVSTASTVAGAGVSAYGALQAGKAQAGQYAYQAGVSRLNKQIADQNRDLAIATGTTEEKQYGLAAANRLGEIRAGAGASGIDIGSGSKADVIASQRFVTGIDEATIANNAARRAYGFEVEGAKDTAQAAALDKAATDAAQAGGLKAMAALISGAGSVADKWAQGKSGGLAPSGSGSGSLDLSSFGFNPISGVAGGS